MEEQLRHLVEVNRTIAGTLDYGRALKVIVEKTAALVGADVCLLLLDDGDGTGMVAASVGVDAEAAARFAAPLDERVEPALRDLVAIDGECRFHAAPVIRNGRLHGLLAVWVRESGSAADVESYTLGALADQAALALANASSFGAVREEVAHKSRLLEIIQESSNSGLAYFDRLDAGLCLVEANSAFFAATGVSLDAVGQGHDRLFAEGRLRATVEAAARGQPGSVPEVAAEDGSSWDWSAQPISGAGGEVTGVALTAVDVTEKVRARVQLEEAAERKNEFLAMLGHELRNPLAAVVNAVHVLEAGATGGNAERALEIAARQSRQMKRLLDDLLDVSRVVRGKVELKNDLVDVRELCRQAGRAVEANASDKRQTLDLQVAEAWVRGDEGRLAQVLSNLLSNSVKYTEAGGTIHLSCAAEGDEVVVHVRDNGRGIPAHELPHVFELFAQAKQRLDRSEGGLGIGLAVAANLVRMHGGDIHAHSEGEGLGTVMTVRLPGARAGALDPSRNNEPLPAGGQRVLLVEDNEDEASVLAAALELAGHEVSVANDGPHGVERALRERPDVVVLDIGLPGMDGFEVARVLRAKLGDRVRLVAVSGYDPKHVDGEDRFDHRLIKPVSPKKLHELIVADA